MTQLERTEKELAHFVGNLNLDGAENDKLRMLICKYVSLAREEAWNSCYDARGN